MSGDLVQHEDDRDDLTISYMLGFERGKDATATALTLAQARIRELETALKPFADFEETLRSWHSGKYNPPFSMDKDEWPRDRAVLVRTRPVDEERSIVRKLHREDFEAARQALKEAPNV